MKSSQPPAVATWLLLHFASKRNRDALAGDLIEEYRTGRSESWYWRQVLIAIFDHSRGGRNMMSNSKWRGQLVLAAVAVLIGSLFGNWIQYRSLNQTKQEIAIAQRHADNEKLKRIQSELAFANWAVPLLTQKLEGGEVKLRTAAVSSRPETADTLRNSVTFLRKEIDDQVRKRGVLEIRQKELESKLRS
jgi:hypothetical protein